MQIGKCILENFGSYKDLEFDFSNTSLSLIYGPTGSGKSTLQDAPIWILFGTTSKNGSVSEVCNWSSEGRPTKGTLEVIVNNTKLTVYRIRGLAQQNDLYWITSDNIKHRGANINDTQRMLNYTLSINKDTFITSTCFNESSNTNIFFNLKPKDKRSVFENIVDLSFPILLSEKLLKDKKEIKENISNLNSQIKASEYSIVHLETLIDKTRVKSCDWDIDYSDTLSQLNKKSKSFETDKQNRLDELQSKSYEFEENKKKKESDTINKLDNLYHKVQIKLDIEAKIQQETKLSKLNKCPTCKRIGYNTKIENLKQQLLENSATNEKISELKVRLLEIQNTKNPYKEQIIRIKSEVNTLSSVIEKHIKHVNPYLKQIEEFSNDLQIAETIKEKATTLLFDNNNKVSALETLYDLSFELRKHLLENTIKFVEQNMNTLIENYFDSEFKVMLNSSESEGLEVELYKDEHLCYYTQLSKGQKQILKLSFAVSIMQITSNNHNTNLNLLMFDEALDGLDTNLKIKTVRMFEELAKKYNSILVIDHSEEIKDRFVNNYRISLENNESMIYNES